MTKNKVETVFDKVEKEQPTEEPLEVKEVDYQKLSDKSVGDNIKYVRENLDKKEVAIDKAQLFNADQSKDPIVSINDQSKKYYKSLFCVTYNIKNKDGLNHREYYSGCIQFVQDNGNLSEHGFWYKGANNQVATLWCKVADFLKITPEELSPWAFMDFMNSKPKAVLEEVDISFQGKAFKKNLIKKFL